MNLVVDIEADNLQINQVKNIWCICCKDINNGETYSFYGDTLGQFPEFVRGAHRIIGHNFIDYDYLVLERFYPNTIDPSIILDTLVISRLLKYQTDDGEGHSLEAFGARFGIPKHQSPNDFQVFSESMLEYCKRDVEINAKLYEVLREHCLNKPEFKQAIETEMAMAWICLDMHLNGFRYDKQRADTLYDTLSKRLARLDEDILKAFPPKLVPVREITPKLTKHGTISKANLPRDWTDLSMLEPGCPFVLCRSEVFNPGSPTQVVARLSAAGWNPHVKTTSGKSFKVCEENLATLPETAPEGARLLVERLLLASRVRTLREWADAYDNNTGRIHGRFHSIGTWPGRMSHRSPNMGNIATKKSIKYKGSYLKSLATGLGADMRSLWICDDDAWLVGTDMEAAHVRIFAHYIDDKEFTQAVISGDKKKGTDVHTLGSKIFSHLGCDRDNHKTFIFSFFNGAGRNKVSEIFGCSLDDASKALELYQKRYPGLDKLKRELIPRYARQGWFPGLDGRPVPCDDEHLMFAGMLQSGEAIIMKMANILWRKELNALRTRYRQVNLVHDEYVTEIGGSEEVAATVGRVQCGSIKTIGERLQLKCPLAGEYKIGKNWLEVH